MPILVWDKAGDKVYESGVDRGVLYLPDGSAVPWNGLTSVIESFNKDTSPIYFDGMKISDLVSLGEFSATMKALTYPDEFVAIEGSVPIRSGVFATSQKPQMFGLCYRTDIGNDLAGAKAGYKIHIVYNVTAIPSDTTYSTGTGDTNLSEFEWKISAVPEEVPNLRPTAHFVINSLETDPWLLAELEAILYGDTFADAALIPMADLVSFITNWYRVKIIDNGDGTWTAISDRDGFISIDSIDALFTIINVNARYLNAYTFVISDTTDVTQVHLIDIYDNGDGTWTATTDDASLISIDGTNGEFVITDANAVPEGSIGYEITDTPF